jgi:hypothetical protein
MSKNQTKENNKDDKMSDTHDLVAQIASLSPEEGKIYDRLSDRIKHLDSLMLGLFAIFGGFVAILLGAVQGRFVLWSCNFWISFVPYLSVIILVYSIFFSALLRGNKFKLRKSQLGVLVDEKDCCRASHLLRETDEVLQAKLVSFDNLFRIVGFSTILILIILGILVCSS